LGAFIDSKHHVAGEMTQLTLFAAVNGLMFIKGETGMPGMGGVSNHFQRPLNWSALGTNDCISPQ